MTDKNCHVDDVQTRCAAAVCLRSEAQVEHNGGNCLHGGLGWTQISRLSSLLYVVHAGHRKLTLPQKNLLMLRHTVHGPAVQKLMTRHAVHGRAVHVCRSPVSSDKESRCHQAVHLSFVSQPGHTLHLLVKLIQSVQDSQACACMEAAVSPAWPARAAASPIFCGGSCMVAQVHAGTT